MRRSVLVAALVIGGLAGTATSATARELPPCDPWAVGDVRAAVPTATSVIGIELGERDVTVGESDAYLAAVDRASRRVISGTLARSVQGRPLHYAIVGEPRRLSPRALKGIRAGAMALMDPDTPARAAERIVRRNPAILWIAGNVHGGEESGTDAALRVLYELAARRDCGAEQILREAIVVILPTQNPDGREADTRQNANGFDMNRDWFARTQPETEGKLEFLRRYPPVLFIDAHEMGADDYFFPPNADPVYHEIDDRAVDWINGIYGAAMQAEFTRRGIPFFNYDTYDLFYAGYGDTVPANGFGAAGMTFEKNNADPAPERVLEQYITQWTSLTAAVRNKERILREYAGGWRDARAQGELGVLEPNRTYEPGNVVENPVPDLRVRHYFLRADDPERRAEVRTLVRRLQRMDVEVRRLTAPLDVPGYEPYGRPGRAATLPAGTYWIPMAQRQKHWVQALLNEDTYSPVSYAYDITGWSNPLLLNLDGGYSGDRLAPRSSRVPPLPAPPEPAPPGAAPAVALYSMSPTFSRGRESSGWLRYTLDRWGIAYRDVSAEDIRAGGLAGAEVLLVPDGYAFQDPEFPEDPYALGDLGPEGQAAIRDWVTGGGRYVGWQDGAALAAALGVSATEFADAPTAGVETPGSLVRAAVDTASPLAAGVGPFAWPLYEGRYVLRGAAAAALRYPAAGSEDFFVSGLLEGEAGLAGTAAVTDEAVGEGRAVLFGFDPNFRAFADGTQRLTRNAIIGPDPAAATVARASGRVRARAAAGRLSGLHSPLRLVVRARGERAARGVLARYGARFSVTRRAGKAFFAIANRGARGADDHPYARQLGADLARAKVPVVLYRMP